MSGITSVAVSGGGGDGYRAPFTAVQWQELEHQALIYKYLVAGVPVPSDLVMPIRRSFEALSARFLQNPTLGYCSYYGKKFDPEPGRCRRTDGKKWRCSKDAYHESKYCEHHMNRGRNRSRKPVESQSISLPSSTVSLPSSTAMSHISTVTSTDSGKGSYRSVSSTSSPNQSLYSITKSGTIDFGSNASKLQVDTSPYIFNKDLRYTRGLTVNIDDQNFASGVSGNVRSFGMDSDVDSSWRLMSSQVQTNMLSKPQNDSYLQSNSLQLNMTNTYEPMIDTTTMSKQRQQHCFFGNEISPPEKVKHEQHSMRPFFDEWSKSKEPWSGLDATTQLSISMDPAFNARNPCPSNDV